jgi:tetratricopeptide (TPR) repeat protein
LREDLIGALRMFRAGDLVAAARACKAVLAGDPDDADACHLLGLIYHKDGQSARAVELIGKAVALRPEATAFRADLADAYRAVGQLERAVDCGREAVRIAPDLPLARINLGIALKDLGRPAEAAEEFRAVVSLRPDDAIARANLGSVLRGLGELDQALAHSRRAVEIDPNLEIAHLELGRVLLDLGRPADALPHVRRAVVLNPHLAQRQAELGYVLVACGRSEEAIPCYLEAVRLDPRLARAYTGLGVALQQAGRPDEALPWLRRAAELEPESLEFVCRLGEAYTGLARLPEAMACYGKAIELKPDRALSHGNLAWLMQLDGRVDEARRHYGTALALEPDHPEILINVGGLHEELGEPAEAEASFRAVLEHHPAHAVALARLATLLRGALPDADLECIRRCLADPSHDEGTRATLLFGLAHVRDARGGFAEAAACLREANALALSDRRNRRVAFEPAGHQRMVNALIEAFQPAFFARLSAAGLDTRRPVFVFGLPRSGTSLVEQVLASHPQVYGAGELILGRQAFDVLPGLIKRIGSPISCLSELDAVRARRLAEFQLGRLADLDGGQAARIVDKGPDNYLYLGMLATLFPRATFIHCRRDLRDVAVSCWITNFRDIRWANAPDHIAARFGLYRRMMDHWRTVLPVPIHDVDYEGMVGDLEGTARRLVDACGLPWEPACLEFHRNHRQVRTSSHSQVRRPIYKESVARWRNYEHHLADLFAALP